MKNKNKTLALFGLIGAVLYAIVAGLVILLSKLLGEPGLTGGLESLFETTFFLPTFSPKTLLSINTLIDDSN